MSGGAAERGRLSVAAAELEAAYAGYAVVVVPGPDGLVLEARRRGPGPGPYAVVAGPAEVRAELEAGLRAGLVAIAREFPRAELGLWTGWQGRRGYAAVLPLRAAGVYAVITTDAAEMRAELAAAGAGVPAGGVLMSAGP